MIIYRNYFWLLKLGAPLNIYFLYKTLTSPLLFADFYIRIPAQIFFIVSAFRCLFPVNYITKAVVHKSVFSSIFFTRLIATFSEVAYIYIFSYLLRFVNISNISFINILSWLMVIQVCISQFFVWLAILTEKQKFYYYEELGWAIIFILNTILSIIIYFIGDIAEWKLLLEFNLIFGIFYLPWQYFHLKSIKIRLNNQNEHQKIDKKISLRMLRKGFNKSIKIKNIMFESKAWGGIIGMTWMICYWFLIIPVWIFFIICTLKI